MLSDRRPILLANARIVDPSRDLDFAGDLLIADGVIRDAKRGIGAAGVPEGTEIVDCRGKIVAPGLIPLFGGEPRSGLAIFGGLIVSMIGVGFLARIAYGLLALRRLNRGST